MEKALVFILLYVGVFIVVGVLCAYPVMLLWNWLIPSIFSLREIGFFEAWGLMLLASFLFKSTSTSSNNK